MENIVISYKFKKISKQFIEKIKKDSLMQNINPSYQYIFRAINDTNNKLNQKDLCEKLNYKASSISNLLKQMEKENLIIRTKDKDDNRAIIISMSEKGRKLDDKIKSIFAYHEEKLQNALNQDDLENLSIILEKLELALKED